MSLTTTTNQQLALYCNQLNIPFKGCFMNDELDQFLDKGLPNGNYIINLQNMNQGGTHWVSMVKDKQNCVYYNDSYGVYPIQVVMDLCKKYKYRLYYNKRNHQPFNTTSCGYWCILFLYYMNKRLKNKPMLQRFEAFTDLFVEDVKLNEKILYQEIKKILPNVI